MESVESAERRLEIAKNLGNNLRKLRKEKGFTREELAEKSNLSANYIYGLEKGLYLPGCIALIDLSNSLNVTVTQLLDEYMYNKKNYFIERVSSEIDNLSDRDLSLILNIIEFCSNKK